ncbi:patronin isoform X5 [Folsomia candida]|uniref:patronin isoform X5 n=1 Tax=Folsomia candida TaxID=158441 RepID=UPI001604B671|nr:patronin isoform X5 [Folsomia candida]
MVQLTTNNSSGGGGDNTERRINTNHNNHDVNANNSSRSTTKSTRNTISHENTIFKPQAKQGASIKWLVSWAYNHKTPEDLAEPFYKDNAGEDHLKPYVVQGLSDAELYCLALCNIYADPNYSQLSPWGIVQALARKGVYCQQLPSDVQLTETVLIQNTPLKISAHMIIIEAMMVLQVKEIISNDRIVNTVQRYGPAVHPQGVWLGAGEMPSDTEEALLLWINRAVLAIKEYIQNNNAHEHNLSSIQVESWQQLPLFQDLSDLADGVGLCSLFAFYCQTELRLSEIAIPLPGETLSVPDSLWNLQLVQRVCKDSLPYNACHFALEDILYLHESMKQNMLNFLADIFSQLELRPSSSVKLLGSHHISIRPGLTSDGVRLRRGYLHQQAPTVIPDLRPSLYKYEPSTSTAFSDRKGMNSRPQSATSTPQRRQNSNSDRQDRNRKSTTLNIFGDTQTQSSGKKSPSNSSVVSVPIRRTPQEYNEKAQSDRSNNKEQRYYAHSRSSDDSEDFVVHRHRNVPTLSQVIRSVSPSSQDERSSPASRMSVSRSISANDEPEVPGAGRPSNWNANKTTYAGRRSRRNSITEADSQLTVENFGGSQDNLNKIAITRNPDKQPAIVTSETSSPFRHVRRQASQEPSDYYANDSIKPAAGSMDQAYHESPYNRRIDKDEGSQRLNNPPPGGDVTFYGKKKFNHSTMYDDNNQNDYDVDRRHEPQEQENRRLSQSGSQGNVTVYVMGQEGIAGDRSSFHESPQRSTSMSNLSRLSDMQNKPVSIVYLGNNPPASATTVNDGHSYNVTSSNGWDRSRTLPAATDYHTMSSPSRDSYTSSNSNTPLRSPYHQSQQQYRQPPTSAQYNTLYNNRQQQPYDSPGYNHNQHSEGEYLHDDDNETEEIAAQVAAIRQKLEERRKRIEAEKSRLEAVACKQTHKLGKAAYLKANLSKGKGQDEVMGSQGSSNLLRIDVGAARRKQLTLQDLESKWLTKTDPEPCRTPEIENMDVETYQQSLARMDTSLVELESDISRLAIQHEKIQRQFFLHGDPPNDSARSRKKVPSGPSMPPSSGRSQWGAPKPFDSSSSDESTPRGSAGGGGGGVYNGDSNRGRPTPRSGSNSINYASPSFRLHSNSETQGNRLFSNTSEQIERALESEKPTPPPRQSRNVYHAPLPTPPPDDDMEPQSVSFVQDDAVPISSDTTSLSSKKSSLHQITSGSKTYRITPESGSPPRPPLRPEKLFSRGSEAQGEHSITSSDENTSMNERGFYITFDNEGPKRPKPPLRTRSPGKRRDGSSDRNSAPPRDLTTEYIQSIVDRVPIPVGTDSEEEMHNVRRRENRHDSEGPGDIATGGELVMDEKRQLDSEEMYEMEKKKERILLQSLKRRRVVEELRQRKETERQLKLEEEEMKQDEKLRKKEEEKARRQAILESYRLKKQEEMDKDSKGWEVQENSTKRFMRPKSTSNVGPRPRPKTIHLSEVDSPGAGRTGVLRRSDSQNSSTSLAKSFGKRGSSNTLYSDTGTGGGTRSRSSVRDPWGSTSSLNQDSRRRATSSTYDRGSRRRDMSTSRLEARSRRDTYLGSQESLGHHRVNSTSSLLDGVDTDSSTGTGRGGAGHRDSDSGVGTCSPPQRRSPSPRTISRFRPQPQPQIPKRVQSAGPQPSSGQQQQHPSCSLPSPSGAGKLREAWPGSLPPGLISRRHRGFDDGASDISSVASSNMDYSGLRLYKQPTAKSNRSIMLNAVEYCVFPGVVNRDHKLRVLDEINRSESKHFLIMFRDAGCQFRALYSYIPESDEVVKLFGVGPKQVTDDMFEKFFKYNSGGKCFSLVHTKHLTVTIDAFTIHNALWQGKRAPAAKTRDYALVI